MCIRDRQLGISQTELAECIGTSKQNLYKYENDIITNIPSDRVEALAKKLNTSPAYIMGWNEDTSLPSPTSENTVSPPCSACDEDASIGDTTAANHTEDEYMPYFPNYMRIGKRIAKTRKEKGLSQKDLAKLIQVNPSTLSLWEGGKQVPPLSMARQLSKILTVDEKYLLGSSAPTIDSIEPSNQLCLLYTSDAADEEDSVDLGGRGVIKKKKKMISAETRSPAVSQRRLKARSTGKPTEKR